MIGGGVVRSWVMLQAVDGGLGGAAWGPRVSLFFHVPVCGAAWGGCSGASVFSFSHVSAFRPAMGGLKERERENERKQRESARDRERERDTETERE